MIFWDFIKRLTDNLKKEKTSFILIGGYALNHYGFSRMTFDIDFLINENNFEKVKIILDQNNCSLNQKTDLFARFIPSFFSKTFIDFVFVDKDTFNKILSSGEKTKIAGIEFIVPAITHLIALKLHALKNNPGRENDFKDILQLIKVNKLDIKSDEFKAICVKFGPSDIHEKICKEKI